MDWQEDSVFSVVCWQLCHWRSKPSMFWWCIVLCSVLDQVCLNIFISLVWSNIVLNYFWKQILSLSSFDKFTVKNMVFFFLLAFYVGLHGACIFDVVGLKNLARGYAIKTCALGLGALMTISTAGNDILRQLSKWSKFLNYSKLVKKC